ncbi:PREDICTED: uncharacterized protein LOC109224984 isoform X2 [Nicotiana attenuata]|uniref:uncharacterized protein LOC109224984 isoform X2 n=1 Tax=Nicotiana attenuata TaxID=49451 RepID=UPI00090477C7|nr:PREDICTED: uncharacterized protein LOC109224984 isoform X2 [Nicotiana attenuata]
METSRKDMSHKISRKIDEHEDILAMEESQHPRSKSIEWTDEKHSSYLKSMEASFVEQLYGSLDLVGWHSQNDLSKSKSLRQKHANPLGQYKVFQDGCWTKIDFGKDEPQLNKTNESGRTVLASPWIKHYKSQGTHQRRVSSNLHKNTPLVKQNQSPASELGSSHKDYVTEVMDQNFVDEDIEEGKSSSREHSTKRTKISLHAGSSISRVLND